MAVAFEVVGPYTVQIMAPDDAANTYITLGRTPNRESPSFDAEIHTEELSSNEWGDEAEQIVYTGMRGVLQFTLVKWDEGVLDDLLKKIIPSSGDPDGQFGAGEIGQLYVGADQGASFMFGVKFLPPGTTGLAVRTFPACYVTGSYARFFNFGNMETRFSMTCQVRRAAATIGVYTGVAPARTQELMIKSVSS